MQISGAIQLGDSTEGDDAQMVVIPEQELPGLTAENRPAFREALTAMTTTTLSFLHWSLGVPGMLELAPGVLQELLAHLQAAETAAPTDSAATNSVRTTWEGGIPVVQRTHPLTTTGGGLIVVGEIGETGELAAAAA